MEIVIKTVSPNKESSECKVYIWLATHKIGHSDICEIVVSDQTAQSMQALYEYIRFCAKMDLLKTGNYIKTESVISYSARTAQADLK